MELEHLLKINNGLNPNIPYIATITSIDSDSNESRASSSFKTLPFVPLPSASPNPLLPTDSGQVSSSPASPVSQTIATTTTLPQADSSSSKITISSSGSGAGFIQWLVPLGGEPGGGYRVDIFDKTSDLKKTILPPR